MTQDLTYTVRGIVFFWLPARLSTLWVPMLMLLPYYRNMLKVFFSVTIAAFLMWWVQSKSSELMCCMLLDGFASGLLFGMIVALAFHSLINVAVCTTASQQGGCGFDPQLHQAFLCWDSMLSVCLCDIHPPPTTSTIKSIHVRLINRDDTAEAAAVTKIVPHSGLKLPLYNLVKWQ